MNITNYPEITIRLFNPEDAEGIVSLIYRNYDNTYYKTFYYDPDAIRKANKNQEIVSVVAESDRSIVGHFSLTPSTVSNIAEIGAAVVDPPLKHMGIMSRMFDHIVTVARTQKLDAIYGEGIMLHPYSQKANLRHGMVEGAILLGEVPSSIEIEHRLKDTKRSGVVVAFLLFDKRARSLSLPLRYQKIIEETYRHGDIKLIPSDRSPRRKHEPKINYRINTILKTGTLVIEADLSVRDIDRILKTLLSHQCDMIFADINLQNFNNIDILIEWLNKRRFFYSGILFSYYHNEDYLRLQRKNIPDIDEEELICFSPFSRKLLDFILSDEASINSATIQDQ